MFGGSDQGLIFVRASKVAGIADDEIITQTPGLPQRIVLRRKGANRGVVAPVGNDRDAPRIYARRFDPLTHFFADRHIVDGKAKAGVPSRDQQRRDRLQGLKAESQSDFRIKVLQPVNQPQAFGFGDGSDRRRQQRRIGLDDDPISPLG